MRRALIAAALCALAGCALVQDVYICLQGCADRSIHVGPIDSPQEQAQAAARFAAARPSVACDVSAAVPAPFATVEKAVFFRSCGQTGACHFAGPHSEAQLDFASPDVHASLLLDAQGAGRCAPELGIARRVQPGDPEHSMIWQLVSGTRCGPHMPFHGTALECPDQLLVYGWIKAGARDNGADNP